MNKKILLLFIIILHVSAVFSQDIFEPFVKRLDITAKGEMTFISNTIVGSIGLDGTEDPNQKFDDLTVRNNQVFVGYVDIDGDPNTFSSSSATLNLVPDCGEILWAGLYWSGMYEFCLLYTSPSPRDA